MKSDYDEIKLHYGEHFARQCRKIFPTVLEQPGALTEIIQTHFAPTHSLGDDLADPEILSAFKAFVLNLFSGEKPKLLDTGKTPEALMAQAGYTLHPECQTEAEIQKFQTYFAAGEKLCTFNGGRLKSNRVWFATKNNAASISRKDFRKPKRQDEYGTSVISIQFSKDQRQTLSIKNRYNHTVVNPDATFGNNLDKIIPGLTAAFANFYHCYDVNCEQKFKIPHYVQAADGKFYRENFWQDDVCFCENNTIIFNNKPFVFNRHSQILADNYLFDLQTNEIFALDNSFNVIGDDYKLRPIYDPAATIDSIKTVNNFTTSFGKINKMQVIKDAANFGKKILIYTNNAPEPKVITINRHNEITGYRNHEITALGTAFLWTNRSLTNFDIPNVTKIGSCVLENNQALTALSLPQVTQIGNDFLTRNEKLSYFSAPMLAELPSALMYNNIGLTAENFVIPRLKDNRSLSEWDELYIFWHNPNVAKIHDKIAHQSKKRAHFRHPDCGPTKEQ